MRFCALICCMVCSGAVEATCSAGQKHCAGSCVHPQTDVNNCGNCGVKCVAPPNASSKCNMGKCEYECKPGFKNCDGKWENGCESAVDTDKKNCGGCGVKCKEVPNAFVACKAKKAVYTCKRGYANCDRDWSNGCECYPETDSKNCGKCGNKCTEPKYYGGEARCE